MSREIVRRRHKWRSEPRLSSSPAEKRVALGYSGRGVRLRITQTFTSTEWAFCGHVPCGTVVDMVELPHKWTACASMRDNKDVPIVPSGFVHQGLIDTGVAKASNALAPDVLRSRYSLGEDWSGSAAVFFRVILLDNASLRKHLREAAQRATSTVFNEVRPDELGLQVYFTFRSVSEQAKLREEAWT